MKHSPQVVKNKKLKIFQGLNREDTKGTKYIREDMLEIEKNYPDDIEIYIVGEISLNKYLKVLENFNIVIDQPLSYEYGMNALYAMAM